MKKESKYNIELSSRIKLQDDLDRYNCLRCNQDQFLVHFYPSSKKTFWLASKNTYVLFDLSESKFILQCAAKQIGTEGDKHHQIMTSGCRFRVQTKPKSNSNLFLLTLACCNMRSNAWVCIYKMAVYFIICPNLIFHLANENILYQSNCFTTL